MRWVIAGLLILFSLLTFVGYTAVIPDTRRTGSLIQAYLDQPATGGNERVTSILSRWRSAGGDPDSPSSLDQLQSLIETDLGYPLSDVPTLVWSTDDNPARRIQCALFRAWHLRTYAEPIDIVTDPTNRDITKTIVQCVAGAGPDIIETYGPVQLDQLVSAGVALDITDVANKEGFGVDRVFAAAVKSMAIKGRQYAFPCNMGYVVLFYHRDLFRAAGVAEPSGPWTIDQLIDVGKKLMAADTSGRRVAIMGPHPATMAEAHGSRLFNKDGTASFFNNDRTITAFRAYQDLVYKHHIMPSPSEAASMAASGGANMNADAASASASALFAAKVSVMVTDGRWSYKGLAERNRDRVLIPAIDRKLASLDVASDEAKLLASVRSSLLVDVLLPLSDGQERAYRACLNDDDRSRLLDLGVAHVPTLSGTPYYAADARVAIVNRASPRAELAARFLRFLASREYNDQINHTFDSICGVPEFCFDSDGIAGPPMPVPGLECFDSPVFADAMANYANPTETSPFIGRARIGMFDGPVYERLIANSMTPEAAAKEIEDRINEQIGFNLRRDTQLRALWEQITGKTFDPSRSVKDQVSDDAVVPSPSPKPHAASRITGAAA